jgi:hypothetical protein
MPRKLLVPLLAVASVLIQALPAYADTFSFGTGLALTGGGRGGV